MFSPKIKSHHLLILFFAIIYIVFQSNNSETDAYAYAISVKNGQNLIFPHHLIYCLPARFIYILSLSIGINVNSLTLLKLINSVTASFCLYFLYKILKVSNSKNILSAITFTGSCFGFLRFATEAETYILPILFSLAASYFFLNYLISKNKKNLIISGFAFGISVLFHQVHVFWFIGFVISIIISKTTTKFKNIITLGLSFSLPVLAAYIIASQIADTGIFKYALNDYYKGTAQTHIGYANFIMTPISLFRTVFQVHGYMATLLSKFYLLIVFSIIEITFLLYVFFRFIKSLKSIEKENSIFSNAVFIGFIFQLIFAFYSAGNSEFMVMLPFLAILYINTKFEFSDLLLFALSIFILLWNIVFGLVPYHFFDIDGSKKLYLNTLKNNNEKWILYNPQKIENISEYYSGKNSLYKFNRLDSVSSPDFLIKNKFIFTDLFNTNESFNRRKMMFKKDESYMSFNKYKRSIVDSIEYSFGKKYIYKVILK
ncbi:MAG: glycosyltransferase family 39 protein [Bacteroidia bacterium]|nr:glycosyltransferase family 39 protein [Bacteroidia bacterium]